MSVSVFESTLPSESERVRQEGFQREKNKLTNDSARRHKLSKER